MSASIANHHFSGKLASTTTYQSGVMQASAYRIIKRYTATALSKYHLTCMQWFTVGIVLDAGDTGLRLSDLAKSLDTTLAYMTNTVNLLESRGILTKRIDKKDARTKYIAVNKSYEPICHEIESYLRNELRKHLYSALEPSELTSYVSVLYKINENNK